MKEKNSESVLSALKKNFKKMGSPMSIYNDNDGAFMSVVKGFLDREGIQHTTTLTHANVEEHLIRTIKNMMHDRVRFHKADWTNMLTSALNTYYNSTEHSSTEMTPKEAHKDTNHLRVGVNLTLKAKNRRKYPPINVDDTVTKYMKRNEATTPTGKRPENSRFLR